MVVTRFSLLSTSVLATLLLLTAAGSASHRQSPAQAGPSSPVSELTSLHQAQTQALTAGDPGAIASTSRTLAAQLLRHLAALERLAHHLEPAANLDRTALVIDPGGIAPPVLQLTPAERRAPSAQAIPLKKLLASTLNDLGTAEARQSQYALARDHFAEALRWDTPTPILLRNLGTAAFRTGDFATAARAFSQYLQPSGTAPADPNSQLMYALSLFSSGDFRAAARAFAPISAQALQDPRAAYSWAFSLVRSGDPLHANTIAAQLSTQPLPPDVLSLVCHIFLDTESYEQSAACYRRILATAPTTPLAHYQLAESLIHLDRPAEAIPELRQELTLTPGNPNVQYSLAFALLQTSSKDEAFKLLRTITADHPEFGQAQYQFGKLLLESGDTPQAITHLELAETADPAPDYVHYQLQSAYRKAGRITDADREARLYREIKAQHREASPSHR